MDYPNPSVGDVVASTIELRSKDAADNITRSDVLLYRLNQRGNTSAKEPFNGGRSFFEEIEYALNGTAMWYSGTETLNIAPQNVLTAAEFPIRQAAVAVTTSGLEELMNAGDEATLDLVDTRVENAENTLRSLIQTGLYSDGTVPKQIGGLRYLISATPNAGIVGGVDAAQWEFWRNIEFNATADGGAAATPANIQRYMDEVWVQLPRGSDRPDLAVTDNRGWMLYKQSLQPIQIISNPKLAEAGFENLKYMGADVVMDGGFQGYSTDPLPLGGAPANHMFFLNTRYLKYRPHRRRNFVAIGPTRHSVNQDASVSLYGWAGNLLITNRRLQGLLTLN